MNPPAKKLLPASLKKDFPIFRYRVNGRPLVYLDSTASAQKPAVVMAAEKDFYERYYANVHRGIYSLSEHASEAYEAVREQVRKFVNARSTKEIIFTKNATESINMVAYSWGRRHIKRGDEIVLTEMEHHANIVPWQLLARAKGARLRFWPITSDGRLDLDDLRQLINRRTKLVAFTHVSNVLGTVNPVAEIVRAIRRRSKALVLVDGAQGAPHVAVNARHLDADFYAFSSHKMLGPTGVGVLYAKEAVLETMDPFQAGGDMISRVTKTDAEWNELPWKFEAGTPNAAGVIGFGAAIRYLEKIGMDRITAHESSLARLALDKLSKIPGLTLYGPHSPEHRSAVFSFTLQNIHPHDIASILDEQGICIRAGHHCAQPLHERLGVPATSRASFYLYNTPADVDALIRGLNKVQEVFGL